MNKVYLLLRNNKQSGPHTLEELLKLGLKPLDLIWIEGKSAGWSYPSEINVLKPYVAGAAETIQQATEKKPEDRSSAQTNNQVYMPAEKQTSGQQEPASVPRVYVSMPVTSSKPAEQKRQEVNSVNSDEADKIEQKAEELRKRIQSYVPKVKAPDKTEAPIVTKYKSTIPEREEEYTSWIYNQKVNKAKKITEEQKKWAAIAVAALLILVAGYGISQYHNDKKEVELVASTEIASADKPVPEPLITEPETPSVQPITGNNIASNVSQNIAVPHSSEPLKKVVKDVPAVQKHVVAEPHNTTPPAELNKKAIVNKPPQKDIKDIAVKPSAEPSPGELKAPQKETVSATVAGQKKKKTLNEKVDAFFSKFAHKTAEEPVEETSSSNTSSSPGVERKAVHRDDKPVAASPKASTNPTEFLEITANKPSENWMLGVHGLKVSLHNSGNESVKTAEVEVRYFTEQNEVLEKKIVSFNNILPGKTITLPAPDHRLADHAEFRLVNAK